MSWRFMERWLLCDANVFSCDARVRAIHANHIEKHYVRDDDGSYGSYCRDRVSTLLDDLESGANSLHDCGVLFLWDTSLGKRSQKDYFDDS